MFATCSFILYNFILILQLIWLLVLSHILQNFHKTESGVLFGLAIHLQAIHHYLFCYCITSFSIKTSLVKKKTSFGEMSLSI